MVNDGVESPYISLICIGILRFKNKNLMTAQCKFFFHFYKNTFNSFKQQLCVRNGWNFSEWVPVKRNHIPWLLLTWASIFTLRSETVQTTLPYRIYIYLIVNCVLFLRTWILIHCTIAIYIQILCIPECFVRYTAIHKILKIRLSVILIPLYFIYPYLIG